MSRHSAPSSHYFHKPENALRRALELQSISAGSSSNSSTSGDNAALALLHDVLSHRRHKTWSPAYEQVMLLYLDLCLKKNKFREAKDGLHQYRNVSQSQAPGSLEIVIKYLMEKAEEKCKSAKDTAEEMAGETDPATSPTPATEEEDDDIVDDVNTHQSILLSTMSLDPEKTQRETAVVLPSIKFLWETYRAILDILRSNSKLEHLYHSAAIRALEFCKTYKRKMEFRRLCDMLRMHLGNLQKYGTLVVSTTAATPDGEATTTAKMNSKVRGWEGWTMDSVELHLGTRFVQLETATYLHFYTEGFRTVEDIYTILQIATSPAMIAKKPGASVPAMPKARLMATYYEKLTTLFWVSENYLFHAFAWYKYYTLCHEYNRSMSKEAQSMQASMVLLSALCIPDQHKTTPAAKLPGTSSNFDVISQLNEHETVSREKMARMATLLGFHTKYPTRQALLKEIKSRGLLQTDIPPYVQQLYELLENTTDAARSNPLQLFQNARPLLKQLMAHAELEKFVKPLSHVLLLKLILHLSSAYYTISLSFLKRLTTNEDHPEDDILNFSFQEVERAIVLFSANKPMKTTLRMDTKFGFFSSQEKPNFSVKIDHKTDSIRFIPNATSSQWEQGAMRYQITSLAKSLNNVYLTTSQNQLPTTTATVMDERAAKYDRLRADLANEHASILERKNIIEKRKEEVERIAREKQRLEQTRKIEEETKRKAEEAARLDRERKLREAERAAKIQKELEVQEKKKFLKALGKEVDEKELENVDTVALAKEHANKATKKKEEAERLKKDKAKKLDHLVRATRLDEIPLVKKREEDLLKNEKLRHETEVEEKLERAKKQWEKDLTCKETFDKNNVFAHLDVFKELSMARRENMHQVICSEIYNKEKVEEEKKKLQRAHRRRLDAEKRRIEEERLRKEAEQKQKEEEERRLREEEKKRKAAEEEKKRQAELQRMKEEREKKEREKALPPPPANDGKYVPPSKKYVPPSRRNANSDAGEGSSYRPPSNRRFADLDSDRNRPSNSRFGGMGSSSQSYRGDRFNPSGGSSTRYENRRAESSRFDRDRDRDRDHGRFDRDRADSSRYNDRDRGGRDSRFDRDNYRDRDGRRPPPSDAPRRTNSRWNNSGGN